MSIKQNIANIFGNMARITNIIINFFSKVKTMRGYAILIKSYYFQNYARFRINVYMSLSPFATNTAFVKILEFENNQEFKPKHNFIMIGYHKVWCFKICRAHKQSAI